MNRKQLKHYHELKEEMTIIAERYIIAQQHKVKKMNCNHGNIN